MKYAMPVIMTALMSVGCQSSEKVPRASNQNDAPDFVVAICGECHAVTANAVSPNPNAPRFSEIANSPGQTRESLKDFLSDAHNYPMEMDVDLVEADIDLVTGYFIILQSDQYER